MSKEIWKPINGFESSHEVSDTGKVRTLDRVIEHRNRGTRKYTGILLKQSISNKGYPYVDLQYDGRSVRYCVHRLVAEAFIPNPENKRTVNHINGDKSNNHVDNLEWNTYAENLNHARRTGLHPGKPPLKQGSQAIKAKLGETDIPMIRSLIRSGVMIIKVADMYGLCPRTIRAIRDGITWRNVPL